MKANEIYIIIYVYILTKSELTVGKVNEIFYKKDEKYYKQ